MPSLQLWSSGWHQQAPERASGDTARGRFIELAPALVLAMWAAGLAASAGAVAWWRIVGPGFLWLSAGVVIALASIAFAQEPGVAMGVGMAAAVLGGLAARRPGLSAVALWLSAVLLYAAVAADGGYWTTAAGAALLGGVSAEMLLGHWYLIDPRLPRWALFRLDAVAAIALVAEVGFLVVEGVLDGDDTVLVWAFVVMAVTTAVLLVAVWFSLEEPAYPAVMAATGLSYLAVLTALGTSVVGRVVLDPTGGI